MQSNCIFIIGMHRSGTSAITRVINLLGVELGDNLYPPQPHNPKGLWEHTEIMQIHEALFDFLGHPWYFFLEPLPQNWWKKKGVEEYRSKILRIIEKDFSRLPLWGLKDPRISRLLPLWHTIFKKIPCKPHFIHIVRNPLEVAASLKKRNNLPHNMSMLLWLQHILEAEIQTRSFPRVFITFDQLLNDCRNTIFRIGDVLGIKWPIKFDTVVKEVNGFLSPDFKHHNVTDHNTLDNDFELPRLAADVYEFCLAASQQLESNAPNSLTNKFDTFIAGIQTKASQMLIRDLSDIVPEIGRLRYQLAQCETQLVQRSVRLTKVLSSKSWRITAPLRSELLLKIHQRFFRPLKRL